MSDTLKKQINQVFYSCRYITLRRSLKWWEQEKIEKIRRLSRLTLREKCPNTEFSLVRIFPHSDWIRRYGISLRIQSECGKLRTRKNSVFDHSPLLLCCLYDTNLEFIIDGWRNIDNNRFFFKFRNKKHQIILMSEVRLINNSHNLNE